jgi:hypothetical protein
MIHRISIILLFLLSSCNKNANKVAVISGVVRDEVTGQPVEGATVGIKVSYTYDSQHYSKSLPGGPTALTAQDGSYILKYTYNEEHPYLGEMNVPYPFPKAHHTYASCEGYIGSDLCPLSVDKNDSADIKLYRPARINIHAKNEGINKLNEVHISFDKRLYYGLFNHDEIILDCSGSDFDSTFAVSVFWANFKYYYTVMSCANNAVRCPSPNIFQDGIIIPKPDSIMDLYISY